MSFYALSCVCLSSIPVALKSRVDSLTTMQLAGHRSPHNNKNWQWLTAEEKWVIVWMPWSWRGQWYLAICSAPLLTVGSLSHTAHCAGDEEAMLLQSNAFKRHLKTPDLLWFLLFITIKRQKVQKAARWIWKWKDITALHNQYTTTIKNLIRTRPRSYFLKFLIK